MGYSNIVFNSFKKKKKYFFLKILNTCVYDTCIWCFRDCFLLFLHQNKTRFYKTTCWSMYLSEIFLQHLHRLCYRILAFLCKTCKLLRSLPVQRSPEKFSWHLHVYQNPFSTQVPPFWHGLEWQTSLTASEKEKKF